jgi:putative membrane protein
LLERLLARWQGILLALIGIVATLWLAVTDQLGLYIHPGTSWFAIVMAIIGALLVTAAFAFTPLDDEHAGEADAPAPAPDAGVHEHERETPPSTRATSIRAGLAAVIVVGATLAFLVLPPATLTSATAAQRSINSETSTLDQSAPTLVGGDTSQFTVKDWAVLLRQNPDAEYFADKSIDLMGFVSPSPADPDNVFYITRFIVTHCAIDAQPVGVPVYLPGWQEKYEADEWVEASGAFVPNPAGSSTLPLLMEPAELTVIEQPDQPYVF